MGIENIDALKNNDEVKKKSEEELERDFADNGSAHVVDEDPEEHIGEEVPDPWTSEEVS